MDEWAYVPDVHLACLGPARDVIWPRWWRKWLTGRKGLGAHTIYAAKVWDGAIFENRVLIQVITIVVRVVRVVALWECESCGPTRK